MKSNVSLLLLLGAIALLPGCSTTQYTVDDGSKVNEALLSNIRLFGQGERLLRPAVERSAGLNDKQCATQWELPFSAATSYAVDSKADRVAWARALQVDERLTVIGATPGSGLSPGDKIVKLDGYHRDNTEKMQLRLEELRQGGDPFPVQTADGKQVTVTPFKVCRGLLRLAAPTEPYGQSFDWETIVHPLEIFNPDLTPDEALWMVLWTQGVSEEGGAKMKSYAFARWTAKTAVNVASLAMAGGAVVQAGKAAASQVMTTASSAVAQAATEEIAKQALTEAAKQAATAAAKEYLQRTVEEVGKQAGSKIALIAVESYTVRQGLSMSLMDRVAATSFDDADVWAFERISLLGGNPVAGASLHRKLLDQNLTHNPFVLDEERVKRLTETARKSQREEMLSAAIRGESLTGGLQMVDMPDSSVDQAVAEVAMPSLGMAATSLPAPMDMPSASDN